MKNMTSILIGVLILAGCSAKVKPELPDSQAGWASRMQQLSQSLSTLLPLALDPVEFNRSSNRELIDRNLLKMAEFSHDLGSMHNKPSGDPTLEYVSKQLHSNMLEAKKQMDLNNFAYARDIIQTTSHYCISCHTQNDKGPQFFTDNTSSFFKSLKPLDKAQYYIATRNFEKGIEEFDKAMNSPDATLEPYSKIENVALKSLAVAVRVKRDPKLSEEMVSRIIDSKWAPAFLRINALEWKRSILEWQKSKVAPKTLKDAKLLMAQGWNKSLETPLSRGGLIYYLRASTVLADLLAKRKPGLAYAETLYTAGLAAEALKELNLFTLDQAYFEACIRQSPNTPIAKKCYMRLEGKVMSSYGAFDGGRMPGYVSEQLLELRKLAAPNGEPWTQ